MGSRLWVLAKVRVTGHRSCQASLGRVAHLRLPSVRPRDLEWGKPHHLTASFPPSETSHCTPSLTATCWTSAVRLGFPLGSAGVGVGGSRGERGCGSTPPRGGDHSVPCSCVGSGGAREGSNGAREALQRQGRARSMAGRWDPKSWQGPCMTAQGAPGNLGFDL